MRDLLINLLASVIAGLAVWIFQRLIRLRKLDRKREFFGAAPGTEVLLFVSKHFSSPSSKSVHRNDVATLIELAAIIRECGGAPTLLGPEEHFSQLGRITEYCVGGPTTNPRTAAHMRVSLPGVSEFSDELGFSVGGQQFTAAVGDTEYGLLARVQSSGRPVFLLIGQTSRANLAAARLLAASYDSLRHLPTFCLVFKISEIAEFGVDHAAVVGDYTLEATTDADA